MKRYKKEIIKLTAKEALLSILDLASPFFEAHSTYRVSARKYQEKRDCDRSNFSEKIRYLKRQGLIEDFVEGKEKFIEITSKGLSRIERFKDRETIIERPRKWDGKWRLVIYDVPKKYDNERGYFRSDLIANGFQKIQESVYVHPFECATAVNKLSSRLNISQYVLTTISEIIQGEEQIIEKFLKAKILTVEDIKKNKNHKEK